MKVVINECHGCFSLSEAARKRYLELAGCRPDNWFDMNRADRYLVQVVEELGIDANGPCAFLRVHDIEAGRWFRINEYDGMETLQYRDMDDYWILATE